MTAALPAPPRRQNPVATTLNRTLLRSTGVPKFNGSTWNGGNAQRLSLVMDLNSQQASGAAGKAAESAAPTSTFAQESSTNVQTAGVAESGMVRRVGEHLSILRCSRLLTVRVGG